MNTPLQEPWLEEPHAASAAGGGTATLFVSLYLVVLAFFILLNSIAMIEEQRVKKAIDSVQKKFSNLKTDKELPRLRIGLPSGTQDSITSFFSPLVKLAKDEVALSDLAVADYGNTMRMSIPMDTLFLKNSSHIRPEMNGFLSQLAREMQNLQAEQHIELEIALSRPASGAALSHATNDSVIARAGTFARKLVEFGALQESLYVGVYPSEGKEEVVLTFLLRVNEKKAGVP